MWYQRDRVDVLAEVIKKKKTRDSEEELEAGKALFEVELYKKTGD